MVLEASTGLALVVAATGVALLDHALHVLPEALGVELTAAGELLDDHWPQVEADELLEALALLEVVELEVHAPQVPEELEDLAGVVEALVVVDDEVQAPQVPEELAAVVVALVVVVAAFVVVVVALVVVV